LFFIADTLLELNTMMNNKLLLQGPEPVQALASEAEIAVMEANYIKRLIGQIRALFRNSTTSTDPTMKASLCKQTPQCLYSVPDIALRQTTSPRGSDMYIHPTWRSVFVY